MCTRFFEPDLGIMVSSCHVHVFGSVIQHNLNTAKTVSSPPSNGDYNFQITCHIINSIMLLCGEFNNAYLDTSFASIDPKMLKLRPIEGTYPEI